MNTPAPTAKSTTAKTTEEHQGHRYFAWALTPDGRFRFWVDRPTLRAELRVEGTYILQTNDATLETLQAVAAYKELQTASPGPPRAL